MPLLFLRGKSYAGVNQPSNANPEHSLSPWALCEAKFKVRMNPTGILAVVEQDLRLIWQLQELCSDYGLKLSVTRSAEEAILYLRGVGIYASRTEYPLPGLILLDTQNKNAADLQILGWLRENQRFSELPVGLLASEPPHKVRVACAIDPHCFIIDRHSLWELPSLTWQLFFPASSLGEPGLSPSHTTLIQ